MAQSLGTVRLGYRIALRDRTCAGTIIAISAWSASPPPALGILLMRGVALCESLLDWLRVRPVLRPTIGGLIVGG